MLVKICLISVLKGWLWLSVTYVMPAHLVYFEMKQKLYTGRKVYVVVCSLTVYVLI